MKRKVAVSLRGISGFAILFILVGSLMLVILDIAIDYSFAFLDTQTEKLAPRPSNESGIQISSNINQSDPINAAQSLLDVTWQTYSDEQLGFSVRYPVSWYDEGSSGSFEGRCFSSTKEGLRTEPRFCVVLRPFVQLPELRNASSAFAIQQQFFNGLENEGIGKVSVRGTRQYTVTRLFQIVDAPAVERVETITPEAEGVEQAYTVAVYVNTPQMGLIRLSMHALNEVQFLQNEITLRQILESFSLLE